MSINNKKIEKNTDVVSDRVVSDIFTKYKTLKERNHKRINEFMGDMNNNIHELKTNLFNQEKCLERADKFAKNSAAFSKFLSIKTKKNQDDILMNKTDTFRLKKELTNLIESQKPPSEKFGKNIWLLSLRRPDNLKENRFTYINVGNERNPTWAPIKESYLTSISNETIRIPNSKSFKDLKSLTKTSSLENTLLKLNVTDNFEKLNNLTVMIIFKFTQLTR